MPCANARRTVWGEKGNIMGILYQAIDPISWVWWLFVLFALMALNELGRTSK